MFPQILCDVAHNQQISIICQPPGKLCSREMLSEKRASEGANDERYGINISVCWTVWLHRSDHEKPPNPCIVNYHYQHLWLTAPSCWTDLTAGRAHAVLCPLKKSMAYSFLNICTKKQFTPKKCALPNQQDILSSVEHKRGQILLFLMQLQVTLLC